MQSSVAEPVTPASRDVVRRLLRPAPAAAMFVAGLVASGAALLAQSQTPPVFRAEANLVEVLVRVTDEKGQFVPNLTLKDFELRDDGRAETVVAFNYVNLPGEPTRTAAAGRPVLASPDMSTVSTNDTAESGRLFVLLLDDILTSADFALPVRTIAREFIEQHVGPGDLMAVFSTAGHGVLNQEFTTDKTRVLQVIDRFLGGPCASTDPEDYNTRVAADVMSTLAKHLSGIRGRRVSLLWISEGIAYDVGDPKIAQSMSADVFGRANIADTGTVAHVMRQAIDTLRQANVTLYAVDPRRLWYPGIVGAVPCQGSRRSVDVLRQFSQQTGGFAAVDTNEFRDSFERIIEENSQYYVLGFQPSRPGRTGDLRTIVVRVSGRPRLRVSARPAYVVAPSGPPSPRPTDVAPVLADALVRNLPTTGLPLRVQAIPRRAPGNGARVHVVVEVAGKDLRFADTNGRHQERLELALRSIDFLARADHNQKTAVTLNLSPVQLEDLRGTHVRWLSTLDMKPGHYSLRVAGHGTHTAQTGAVFLDIDIPKFEDDTLWIGGLAVSSPAALAVQTGTLPDALGLPGPPTTTRAFRRGDTVTVAAEVATPLGFGRGSMQMTVQKQVAAAGGPPLVDQTATFDDRAAAHEPRAWAIDTDALGSGQFVLRLTLRDQNGQSASTALLFEVIER